MTKYDSLKFSLKVGVKIAKEMFLRIPRSHFFLGLQARAFVGNGLLESYCIVSIRWLYWPRIEVEYLHLCKNKTFLQQFTNTS